MTATSVSLRSARSADELAKLISALCIWIKELSSIYEPIQVFSGSPARFAVEKWPCALYCATASLTPRMIRQLDRKGRKGHAAIEGHGELQILYLVDCGRRPSSCKLGLQESPCCNPG